MCREGRGGHRGLGLNTHGERDPIYSSNTRDTALVLLTTPNLRQEPGHIPGICGCGIVLVWASVGLSGAGAGRSRRELGGGLGSGKAEELTPSHLHGLANRLAEC